MCLPDKGVGLLMRAAVLLMPLLCLRLCTVPPQTKVSSARAELGRRLQVRESVDRCGAGAVELSATSQRVNVLSPRPSWLVALSADCTHC